VRVSADGIATHRNWSGLLVGTKLGTVETDPSTQEPPPGQDIFTLARIIFRNFRKLNPVDECNRDFSPIILRKSIYNLACKEKKNRGAKRKNSLETLRMGVLALHNRGFRRGWPIAKSHLLFPARGKRKIGESNVFETAELLVR
jgi:hypothetical protein